MKDRDLLAYRNRELRNRTALLELLAVNRLHDLEVAARVAVLDALQMMRISGMCHISHACMSDDRLVMM